MRLLSNHTSKIELNLDDVLGLIKELNRLKILTKEGSHENPYLLKLYGVLQDVRSELTEDEYYKSNP